jgi:hypothetical protein
MQPKRFVPALGDRLSNVLGRVTEIVNRRAEAVQSRSGDGSAEWEQTRFFAAGLRSGSFVTPWPLECEDRDLIRVHLNMVRVDLERRLRALKEIDGQELSGELVKDLDALLRELGAWPWMA